MILDQRFAGERLFDKLAARITFYNINRQVPTTQSPIIYDVENQRVYLNPNGGFATHYQIYDYLEDKGFPIPASPQVEAHGYYHPESKTIEWYRSPYYVPNANLTAAIISGIQKAAPKPRQPKTVPLCQFKWAAPDYLDIKETDGRTYRPVIYWVDEDRVYLGRPDGAHYEIYEIMEDDGFDPSGSTGYEVHGYWHYRDTDFKWYEPGAYGYEANRLPQGDEEDRIRATIVAQFASVGVVTS